MIIPIVILKKLHKKILKDSKNEIGENDKEKLNKYLEKK